MREPFIAQQFEEVRIREHHRVVVSYETARLGKDIVRGAAGFVALTVVIGLVSLAVSIGLVARIVS